MASFTTAIENYIILKAVLMDLKGLSTFEYRIKFLSKEDQYEIILSYGNINRHIALAMFSSSDSEIKEFFNNTAKKFFFEHFEKANFNNLSINNFNEAMELYVACNKHCLSGKSLSDGFVGETFDERYGIQAEMLMDKMHEYIGSLYFAMTLDWESIEQRTHSALIYPDSYISEKTLLQL